MRYPIAYAVFLVPSLLLAWFHHTAFRPFVVGITRLYGGKPLPLLFDWLQNYGGAVYVLPVIIIVTGALSSRYAVLREPLCIALCGGTLALACVCYTVSLSLPVLTLGLPC